MAPNLKRVEELVAQGAPPGVAIQIAAREAASRKKSATSLTSNLTSNGRPRDPRLLERLAKQERRRKCRAGVDREDVVTMVGILRTYIVDDGVVEFERAWRLFRAEHPKLAARLERHFELAWRILRGEERRVADVENLHQDIVGSRSDQSTEHPEKGMKLWQVATLFEHFSRPPSPSVQQRPMEPLFAIYHTSSGPLSDVLDWIEDRRRLHRLADARQRQRRQRLRVLLFFLLLTF